MFPYGRFLRLLFIWYSCLLCYFFLPPTQLMAHYYEWTRPSVNKYWSVYCFQHCQTTDVIHQCLITRAVLILPILQMLEAKWFTLNQGKDQKRVYISWIFYVTPGHRSVFPFEISKSIRLAGSFHSCYEKATSSSLKEMLIRETAIEYNSEDRKIRESDALLWDGRK